ncbi:MAG: HAD family phosphatase [bacterium]|nr:HAD family phosphatase [bacterium]
MLKAILWDNDGVLVDTETLYFQAGREILEGEGVELTKEKFVEQSLKKGLSVFDVLPNQDPAYIGALRLKRNARYSALLSAGVQVMDGAHETLAALHPHLRMAVVTGSRKDHFDIIHAQTDMLPFFEFVLTREGYDGGKPHPDAYLAAMRLMGLRADACVVVEDSERGCRAAADAGLRVFAVPNALSGQGDFSPAYKILSHVRQVRDEIEFLRGGPGSDSFQESHAKESDGNRGDRAGKSQKKLNS